MIKIYGIKNCGTMQKAFAWLNENEIEFEFHDYKKSGINTSTLKNWLKKAGLPVLINSKGLTFKKLSEKDKKLCEKVNTAIPLLIENTSMIKRPVIEYNEELILGFEPELYSKHFKKN